MTPSIPPPPLQCPTQPSFERRRWDEPVPPERRIFCNRTLNMNGISAVGFDMDYTLSQYRPETFEMLAYNETVKKLVNIVGYPEVVLDFEFDWRYMVRGLTIDKERGNILKLDRHKYVKVAYHGFRQLQRGERQGIYNSVARRENFDEPKYALIDTLFSLAEAHLFAQLVELKDSQPELFKEPKSYYQLYVDVRAAVDLCHRDGSLKQAVAREPEKYIYYDDTLVPMLKNLRKSGKKLFVVTNSLWDYTNVVMNYLIGGKVGADKDYDWLHYFDVVVTGSGKPRFFHEGGNMFEVDKKTGYLINTDNGSPMAQVGVAEEDYSAPPALPASAPGGRAPAYSYSTMPVDDMPPNAVAEEVEETKVYQGGKVDILHSILGISSGSQVLYVGDHIYGDVLRSKKALGWRTMLVVPELEREIKVLKAGREYEERFLSMRRRRDALDDQVQALEWTLAHEAHAVSAVATPATASAAADLEALKAERNVVRTELRELMATYHASFHLVWGQLMKTGYQNSRFASQVERFACLYTSHVGNLRFYSPHKVFRTTAEDLPHDSAV